MVYPATEPYDEGWLQVTDLHTLHYTQAGNPRGKPVIFLHGGPGGNTKPSDMEFFDPTVWRVILLDQRGAGKSKPTAELKENATWYLVADIEYLRSQLGIQKWMVFGGSWGSTLALAYSQTFPESCTGLILRGIWLVGEASRKWMTADGAGAVFPEAWQELTSLVPPGHTGDVTSAYNVLLNDPDRKKALRACRIWNKWELSIGSLLPSADSMTKLEDEDWNLSHARLEAHYFSNDCWLEEGQLTSKENIDKIRHLPCTVIHGRYDMCCPAANAWALKKAWPELKLHFVLDAGHSAKEKGTLEMLCRTTDAFAKIV